MSKIEDESRLLTPEVIDSIRFNKPVTSASPKLPSYVSVLLREQDAKTASISFKAGIREVVESDKALMAHILQAPDGSWSIESWRLKAFYRRRQAQLKKWGID